MHSGHSPSSSGASAVAAPPMKSLTEGQLKQNLETASTTSQETLDSSLDESHGLRKGEMRLVPHAKVVRLLAQASRGTVTRSAGQTCFIDRDGVTEVVGFADPDHAVASYLRDSASPSECPSGSLFLISVAEMLQFPAIVDRTQSATAEVSASDFSPTDAVPNLPDENGLGYADAALALDSGSPVETRTAKLGELSIDRPESVKALLCALLDDEAELSMVAGQKLVSLPQEKMTPTVFEALLLSAMTTKQETLKLLIYRAAAEGQLGELANGRSVKFRSFLRHGLADSTTRALSEKASALFAE